MRWFRRRHRHEFVRVVTWRGPSWDTVRCDCGAEGHLENGYVHIWSEVPLI